VIEEAPAPGLTDEQRAAMGAAAVAAARVVNYRGAGTVEFLYDGSEFYFLEMNTRLQVEHPVTELITGLDLVEWQIRVASGEPLPLSQSAITRGGHAVEARLYAEDPDRGFLPSTGTLRRLRFPDNEEHVRIDAGVDEGDEVTVHYDPMIAKVIAWAPDRASALRRLQQALEHTEIEGVRTNARFLWQVLEAPAVQQADVSTRLLESENAIARGVTTQERQTAWLLAAAARLHADDDARGTQQVATPWHRNSGFRLNGPATIRAALRLDPGSPSFDDGPSQQWLAIAQDGSDLCLDFEGRSHRVAVHVEPSGTVRGYLDGQPVAARIEGDHDRTLVRFHCLNFAFSEDTGAEHRVSAEHEGHFRAPMPGHVLDVRVQAGQVVEQGTVLLVLEAMKMEHSLTAPWRAQVAEIQVQAGQRVEEGSDLVRLEPAP
jgi:3-methylcrotonyl-CoA carboxylase alpha subunit